MSLRIRPLLTVLLLCIASITAAEDRTFVAVLDLVGQNFSQQEATVVSDQLRVELLNTETFRMVERSQVDQILKEQGFQQTGCTDDACAVEMGQLLGVKNIILGSLGAAGSYTMLTLRILDVATGEVVLTASNKTKGGVDAVIETGVKDIAVQLGKDFRKQRNGGAEKAPSTAVGEKAPAVDAAPAEGPAATEPATSVKPKKKTGKVIAAVTIGAALVGGAVAAYLVFGKKSDTSKNPSAPTTDVEIHLP